MSLRLFVLRGNSVCCIDRGVVVMGRNRPSSDPFASNRRSPTLQRRRREQRVDDANVVAFRSNPFVATTKGASCRFGISAFPPDLTFLNSSLILVSTQFSFAKSLKSKSRLRSILPLAHIGNMSVEKKASDCLRSSSRSGEK